MSYIDFMRFAKNPDQFYVQKAAGTIIEIRRQKTKRFGEGSLCQIPITWELRQLLDKFEKIPAYTSNHAINDNLRTIGKKMGLDFDLCNKHGRTTCAMWLLEDLKYDYTEIQKVLGHKNITTTQKFYADLGVDGFYERIKDIFPRTENEKAWAELFMY